MFRLGLSALTLGFYAFLFGFIYDGHTLFVERPWYSLGDWIMFVALLFMWFVGLVATQLLIWRTDW